MKEMMDNTNIPIFLASNDNYAPFVATTMASICYNTKSFIEFYILDGGITNFRKKQIEKLKEKFNNFSIEFIKVDFEKYFNNFKIANYWSLDMYSRFLIPLIKMNINKAIYIDVDVIVLDDIKKLYQEKLDNYALAAIPEITNMKVLNKRKKLLNMNDNSIYFNSGVLLIDCKKWRMDNIFNKILDIENCLNGRLSCPDQDLLNKFFDNNYKRLSVRYNLLNGYIHFQNNIIDILTNTIIRHFEGGIKPWMSNVNEFGDKIKYFEEFWFFAKMTPFYDGLLNNFIFYNSYQNTNGNKKKIYKIFGILPIAQIKIKNDKSKIYLFNFIPLLTIKNK